MSKLTISAIFIAFVVVGGVVYWASVRDVQPPDIVNWQTYRNEEYGFEFRYPENVHSIENSQIQETEGLVIQPNIKGKGVKLGTIGAFVVSEPFEELTANRELKETVIAGRRGSVFEWYGLGTYYFLPLHAMQTLVLIDYYSEDRRSLSESVLLFNRMLTTFRFVSDPGAASHFVYVAAGNPPGDIEVSGAEQTIMRLEARAGIAKGLPVKRVTVTIRSDFSGKFSGIAIKNREGRIVFRGPAEILFPGNHTFSLVSDGYRITADVLELTAFIDDFTPRAGVYTVSLDAVESRGNITIFDLPVVNSVPSGSG